MIKRLHDAIVLDGTNLDASSQHFFRSIGDSTGDVGGSANGGVGAGTSELGIAYHYHADLFSV